MRILIFFALFLSCYCISAQRIPSNDSLGFEGFAENSWIFGWNDVPYSVYYEYLITDNPLCNEGCAGDTRRGVTFGNKVTEYGLKPDTWYYWTFKTVFKDSTSSYWADPIRFKTSKKSSIPPIVLIPSSREIQIDTRNFANDQFLSLEIIHFSGIQLINQNLTITKEQRYIKIPFDFGLKGLVIAKISNEKGELLEIKKILLQ